MPTRISIPPQILTWAIDRAGYDLAEFEIRVPNVKNWLSGKKEPTVKQLEDFAKKVHIPFGYLLLPEPPTMASPIPFFRTKQEKGKQQKLDLGVYDTIQDLKRRQDWLRDYLLELGQEPLPFVGKFTHQDDLTEVVNDIRITLGLTENWAASQKNWQEALNYLSQSIEDQGIIMAFNGVVGNNTSRSIPVEECRGFVLVDEYAPFMFVNNADAKAAQMFTIVHELAHVWIGKSAGFDFRQLQPADDPVERFCDQVAAEFLVPKASFLEIWEKSGDFKKVARHFKVSEIVIARRALDLGMISRAAFFQFYNEYTKRDFDKRANQGPGGDFYATARKRLSPTFAHHVNQAVQAGEILYRDAYRLTGLKGDTFHTFMTQHL